MRVSQVSGALSRHLPAAEQQVCLRIPRRRIRLSPTPLKRERFLRGMARLRSRRNSFPHPDSRTGASNTPEHNAPKHNVPENRVDNVVLSVCKFVFFMRLSYHIFGEKERGNSQLDALVANGITAYWRTGRAESRESREQGERRTGRAENRESREQGETGKEEDNLRILWYDEVG